MGSEIGCEIIPIPPSSPFDVPKHALFFHRFPEQGTDSANHIDMPKCSMHHDAIASVQCLDCVKNGSAIKQSYHCTNKCFLDAWKKHILYHPGATVERSFNDADKVLSKVNRCNSWPPGDMISWFDARLEVVLPRGRRWVNRVGSSNMSVPLADDVGFSFKLGATGLAHLQVALSGKDALVTASANQRLYLSPRCLVPVPESKKSEKFNITENISKAGTFNVLSYNILSDIYVYPEKYFYCPQWALTWEYRRRNLLNEIILYDADILCLQEVQSDHFENFLKPELANIGYSAVYKKKTKEVYTGHGYTIDGCAIFFRSDIFREVIAYELEFSKTALSLVGKMDSSQRGQARVRLIKDNIALVVVLELVGNGAACGTSWSRLCVVNTHIYASKGSPDVKLLQVSDLISEIEKIIDPRMPLFICGDINSIPESEPYTLLTKHEVTPACAAEACDPLGIHQHLKLHHSMKLESAYTSAFVEVVNNIQGSLMTMMDWRTREPLFTSLTLNHKRTLDYIFHTVDNLKVEGLLELPDCDSVGRALPSPLWSSDHIALMASFRIIRPFLG